MTDFYDYLKEQLKDPEFRAEYGALEPEFSLMQAMINARREAGLTQKQVSERTGISQSDISKFESGGGNPSMKTLKRLAAGLGMSVKEGLTKSARADGEKFCDKRRRK
ncbi:MAG: helix-turn-helix domain-containing protein, partial [Oscillospiraceae bacterium]|nr:helix-turn-helix domain-containing protein [Oscillospiraceae bacterium]